MNFILLRKQETSVKITKSLKQYPKIKAQASDEIQPVENYGNNLVFDDLLLPKQESNIDLFLTRGSHNNFDIQYESQNYFHLPEITIHNFSKQIILFKQM